MPKKTLKIAFVSSEIAPFAKTGGLGDVVGSLPQAIEKLGHEIVCIMPRYKCIDVLREGFEVAFDQLAVPIGDIRENARVYRHQVGDKVSVYFIDYPELFCRDELYGTATGDYPDNDQRFIFFQRGALELLVELNFSPDVVHAHDWQTGLIPVYLKSLYKSRKQFKKTKSVFTIHNLAYQGNFPPDTLPSTGLGWDHFKLQRLEFYGKVSFIKGGLVYSDVITTVSQTYAQEIQTNEFGCGLEGVLKERREDIKGIVNGIDYDEWNPKKDKHIPERYDLTTIEKKGANKAYLQKENNLKVDPELPLYGIISRLVDQKGIDILIATLDQLAETGAQFVLLGTGDEKYHQLLRDMAKQHRGQFGIHIVFDTKMAKEIYAGSDFMIIPSYYEPCGLAQMISLRYGTIPIVRATGGLSDTVSEFDPHTGVGNGFRFEDYTGRALFAAMKRANQVFSNKESWKKLIKNAMECDFSWTVSAKKYVDLYNKIEKRKINVN